MDSTYAEVGTEVVLCFYRPERYSPDAKFFICKKTIIIETGRTMCRVKIDNGYYWWPIDDMILASDIDLLTPDQRKRIK